jgi:hypothetical protein
VPRLSTDVRSSGARPYFLWNEDLTVADVHERLRGDDEAERLRLLTILLREARDVDVWEFVTPEEVAAALPRVASRLGRRRAFWEFLIDGWRRDGILER